MKYDVVSLDIFDTTLFRLTAAPVEIFQYISEFALMKEIEGFKEKRIKAQKLAEQKNKSANLEDIYSELSELFSLDKNVCNELKKTEVEIEKNCIVPNPQILELIDWCKKNKKKVCFTSDMYLSSEVLKGILKSNGFDENIDIFVSNECKASKVGGDLFKIIQSKYPNKRIIHIGDVLRSDALNPVFYGQISSVLYKNQLKNVYDKCLMMISNKDSIEYQWGVRYLSPVLFEFCNWIYNKCCTLGADRILFLTREGAYFKRLFDFIYGDRVKNTELFFASRRSIVVALSFYKWDYAIDFFNSTRCTVEEAANMYHIEEKSLYVLLEKYQISKKQILFEMKNKEKFLSNFKKLCVSYAENQYFLFKKYIQQFSLKDGENIAVVDIGWRGTMQCYLQDFLVGINVHVKLIGLYFGEYGDLYKNCTKYGFLCSSDNMKYYNDLINATYLFEHILMPNIGTTLGYTVVDDDKVAPITRKTETNLSTKNVQKGVDDAFHIMRGKKKFLNDTEGEIYLLMWSLRSPSFKLADALGDIEWSDVDERRFIAKPHNKLYYLKHPGKVIFDIQHSGWNTGFLIRFFRIKLPYFKFYILLKKIREKKQRKGTVMERI